MAQRIPIFDWSGTSLGPNRPMVKQSAVICADGACFARATRNVVGRAGHILDDDAYAVIADGRHPSILGSLVEKEWPEVADFNRNVVDTCLVRKTLSYRDKQLVLLRSGAAEDVWLDLYCSPFGQDDGSPVGVIAIVIETTERVVAGRRQQEAEASLTDAQSRTDRWRCARFQ